MPRKFKKKIGSKNLKLSLLKQKSAESILKKKLKNATNNGKPKVKKAVAKNQQHQKETEEKFVPFNKDETLMLVGEGDFSFARSIIEEGYIKPENLIVTSYDNSVQELKLKYPNTFEKNHDFLLNEKVLIIFKIDTTNLIKSFKLSKKTTWSKVLQKYGRPDFSTKPLQNIMFNFPHNGKGTKDMDRNIMEHQNLVNEFYKNCLLLFTTANSAIANSRTAYTQGYSLTEDKRNNNNNFGITTEGHGKIILSVFTGEPYDLWQIKHLAKQHGLQVERSNKFQWENYPSYHHKRTNSEQNTTKPAEERTARVYIFTKVDKKKNMKENSKDDDSE